MNELKIALIRYFIVPVVMLEPLLFIFSLDGLNYNEMSIAFDKFIIAQIAIPAFYGLVLVVHFFVLVVIKLLEKAKQLEFNTNNKG